MLRGAREESLEKRVGEESLEKYALVVNSRSGESEEHQEELVLETARIVCRRMPALSSKPPDTLSKRSSPSSKWCSVLP